MHNHNDAEPVVILLIRNGAAVDAPRDFHGRTPLDWAIENSLFENPRDRRLVPTLLRAGAALPADTDDEAVEAVEAYIQKLRAAGGIKKYTATHLATLTKTVKSKLGLPTCPARLVVEYAFHAGDY